MDNGFMVNAENEENQTTVNKINIMWLVRHVQKIDAEMKTQTRLMYTLLITIISGLIGIGIFG